MNQGMVIHGKYKHRGPLTRLHTEDKLRLQTPDKEIVTSLTVGKGTKFV